MTLILSIVVLVIIVAAILWALRGGPPKADGNQAGDSTGASRFGG